MRCHQFIRRILPSICIGFITLTLVWGCSSSSQSTSSSREVSNQDAVIVFELAGWPDVSFTHQRQAEYWSNNYKITFTFN